MGRLKHVIKGFIHYWNNPESKKEELYRSFKKSLRKIDGIEVPYYDIPYELWEGRKLCQVIVPLKKSVIAYNLQDKEIEKEITRSFVLTKQLVDDTSLSVLFGDNSDSFNEIKRWIRYFKKVHRRESWKFLKEKIGIPVLVGIILGTPEALKLILKIIKQIVTNR